MTTLALHRLHPMLMRMTTTRTFFSRKLSTTNSLLHNDELVKPRVIHKGRPGIWKALSLLVALPTVIFMTFKVLILPESESQETACHSKKHGHDRPEFKPYEHMRIRTKRFPWGDGNKSLIHNPHVNALPEGYEDELEGGEE